MQSFSPIDLQASEHNAILNHNVLYSPPHPPLLLPGNSSILTFHPQNPHFEAQHILHTADERQGHPFAFTVLSFSGLTEFALAFQTHWLGLSFTSPFPPKTIRD